MGQYLSTQVTRALHKIDQYFGASDEESERHAGVYSMQELAEAVERLRPFKPSMFERLLEGTENTPTVKDRFGSHSADVQEQIESLEISPLIRRFGTWAVTDYGVECLIANYSIEMDRVFEPDWLAHMKDKNWVILGDFAAALGFARILYGAQRNVINHQQDPTVNEAVLRTASSNADS